MPRKYVKTGESPEGRERRLRAFRHNAMSGHVRMMQMQLLNMITSDTTTPEAKAIAADMRKMTDDLLGSLKTRVD